MSTPTRRLSRGGRPWRLEPRAWRRRRTPANSWMIVAIFGAASLLVTAVIAVCVTSMSPDGAVEQGFTAAETVPVGQEIVLPLAPFADGRARFYRHVRPGGREIRFFVMKSGDGQVRAAFDACDNCFRERRGFRQAGDHLVCNHCGRAFLPQHVNVLRGDCNPAPLDGNVDGDRLILQAAAIEQGSAYF